MMRPFLSIFKPLGYNEKDLAIGFVDVVRSSSQVSELVATKAKRAIVHV